MNFKGMMAPEMARVMKDNTFSKRMILLKGKIFMLFFFKKKILRDRCLINLLSCLVKSFYSLSLFFSLFRDFKFYAKLQRVVCTDLESSLICFSNKDVWKKKSDESCSFYVFRNSRWNILTKKDRISVWTNYFWK